MRIQESWNKPEVLTLLADSARQGLIFGARSSDGWSTRVLFKFNQQDVKVPFCWALFSSYRLGVCSSRKYLLESESASWWISFNFQGKRSKCDRSLISCLSMRIWFESPRRTAKSNQGHIFEGVRRVIHINLRLSLAV